MIGIVINYCSLERMFIDALLQQCTQITPHVAVSYGDRLYNGVPEDTTYVTTFLKRKYPFVKFVPYEVNIAQDMYKLPGVVKRPTAYWCNLARWQGMQALPNVDWFFFLDADEIPDSERLLAWLKENTLDPAYSYKFANYWYFKDVIHQSTTYEDSILCVHRKHLSKEAVFHDQERDGILEVSAIPQKRMVLGVDQLPMFHHFSWVRSKENLAKKLATWAHRDDLFKNAPIEGIVHAIYRNDEVNDIIHNYTYQRVANRFDIHWT